MLNEGEMNFISTVSITINVNNNRFYIQYKYYGLNISYIEGNKLKIYGKSNIL